MLFRYLHLIGASLLLLLALLIVPDRVWRGEHNDEALD